MPKKVVSGECAICGANTFLNEEHLPPQAAFNNVTYTEHDFLELLKYKSFKKSKNKPKQGGVRFNSICFDCNNFTGTNYVPSYIRWCKIGEEILKKSNFNPSLYSNYKIFPLKVLKQIITMFFTVNRNTNFRIENPELVEFTKDKFKRNLDSRYQIYCHFMASNFSKQIGNVILANINDPVNSFIKFSEFSFYPFGYILTKDAPIINSLENISFFSEANIHDLIDVRLKIPYLGTGTHLPGSFIDSNGQMFSPFKNIYLK